jgi:hypothetical protein
MKKIIKHVFIPLTITFIFFATVLLPVELVGCRNRGLIAAVVAIAGGIIGIAAAVKALKGRIRGDSNSSLWMTSAIIFAIPAIYIVLDAT